MNQFIKEMEKRAEERMKEHLEAHERMDAAAVEIISGILKDKEDGVLKSDAEVMGAAMETAARVIAAVIMMSSQPVQKHKEVMELFGGEVEKFMGLIARHLLNSDKGDDLGAAFNMARVVREKVEHGVPEMMPWDMPGGFEVEQRTDEQIAQDEGD